MSDRKPYIRFDWAMKRLLRDKANFGILEGLLTTLLERPIHIRNLIESESNKVSREAKLNRVDLLCEDASGELIIIEVQNVTDATYFHRMLFAASTLVTEYLAEGSTYDKIRKVYSVNIVYFNLGVGEDYVYHGGMGFTGLHKHDVLRLSPRQQEMFGVKEVSDIFPEFYILKANEFDSVAATPLDEWVSFLHSGCIGDGDRAPGLDMAREKLQVEAMSPRERAAYNEHRRELATERVNAGFDRDDGERIGLIKGLQQGLEQGRQEGLEQGRQQGRAETEAEIRQRMEEAGLSEELIAKLLADRQ